LAEADPALKVNTLQNEQKFRFRKPLMLIVPMLIIAAALMVYLSGGRYESTENASLQTGMVAIAASISGKVTAVEVKENQLVKTGDVLFRIDSGLLEAAVAESKAQLAAARADVVSKRADFNESQSTISAAQARLSFARGEAARQQSLLREGISSRAQYDAAVLAVRTALDGITAARAKGDSLLAELGGNSRGTLDTLPAVRKAQASLERSRITLGDTVVRAPQDGIVTRVHQLQVGNYVTAGKPLFVMTGTRYWVLANFKESQLRYMRVGQTATVKIDAFPDYELKAHVASFSPGTGNSFSLLPAENASGNWVKVVQRLPVELALDAVPQGLPLHAGLSLEASVDTGHKRSLLGDDKPKP
jgi:membrane fusion protein (multidrug efflux system)